MEVPKYRSISNLLMHLMLSVLNEHLPLLFWLHSYVTSIKFYWASCEGPDRTVKNRHSTWKEGDIFTLVSWRSTKLLLIPFTKVTRGQRLGQLLLYWSQKKISTFFFLVIISLKYDYYLIISNSSDSFTNSVTTTLHFFSAKMNFVMYIKST